jgi:hypothetical protein
MRYWWVNQNQTWLDEFRGGYMWSPKRSKNDRRNRFYDNMRIVAPEDIVFSYADTRIIAIGIIQSVAFESPKPLEFGRRGDTWSNVGWRVNVRYQSLTQRIRPADFMQLIRPVLPPQYSPLSPEGKGYQQIYLAGIPEGMAHILATLIGQEAQMIVTPFAVRETVIPDFTAPLEIKEAWETHVLQGISGSSLAATEKEALVRARRGQGRYRQELLRVEHECRISHVRNPEYLIASHIKPWRHSDNGERLDGENGLLLNPNVDLLFDRGIISFEDNGDLILSPVADCLDLPKMGIDLGRPLNVGGFTSGQKTYLAFHRRDMLLKVV